MQKIILTTSNLTASLNRSEPAYYVIEEVVTFMKNATFPAGSVLDFRGGSFESFTMRPFYVDLNGSTVYAPAYCIFYNVDVSGFSNSYIRSEWFKTEGSAEHTAINRSLKAADGIPVHLEGRTYELTDSIVFPDLAPKTNYNQTLVCPGTLKINNIDKPAIIVDKTYVNLDINKIQYSSGRFPSGRAGTGIKLTGNAYYLDISVNTLENLDKAIAVIPDLSSTTLPWSGIQYCTIRFKDIINAEYCFYVDLFNNGNTSTPSGEVPSDKWFSEARVIGGKMSGVNGIYFVNPDIPNDDQENDQDNNHKNLYKDFAQSINGLLFENITFEQLSGMPMYIGYISSSKFLNLRFGSDLTGADDQSKKWIYLNYVSYLTISVQEPLDPNRILIDEEIRSVIFDAFVIDNYDSSDTPICHFDRLAIMPLTENQSNGTYKSLMTATSSIQPYNMAKTIFSDDEPELGFNPKQLTLNGLLPLNNTAYPPEDEDSTDTTEDETIIRKRSIFNVLPRTLNLIIKQDDSIEIDLTGLSKLAPCVIDVYAMIEPRGSLVLKTSEYPDDLIVLDDGEMTTQKLVTFNEWGLYRLTLDSEWNVVISKVTL